MYVTVSLKVDLGATSSIDEMEKQIQEAGRAAMKEALKQALRQQEDQQKVCPHCGTQESRSQGTITRVLLTSFGRVEVALRRQRCRGCGRRFRPADACLELLRGRTITPELREMAALAGSSWPYETASSVLKRLSGANISDEQVRQITNEQGQGVAVRKRSFAKTLVEPRIQQIRAERDEEARRKTRCQSDKASDELQIGLDGGWIACRDQAGGMEGKIGVIASETEPVGKRGRHRLSQRLYVATFEGAEEVGALAYAAAEALGATEANRQVVLGDGAEWIKTQAAQHFPDAVKVLDWPHLWRVIHKAIRAVHPGKSAQRRAWRKQQYEHLRPMLWQGQVDQALIHLRHLRPAEGQEPIKPLEDALMYLSTQRDWIGNYEQWRADGYPVGSGLVERAVALVINARMKKRGMRWKRKNATAVVALRVQQINARWLAASMAA